MEETLKALADKINELEAQLSQVPHGGAGASNAASQAGALTVSPTGAQTAQVCRKPR